MRVMITGAAGQLGQDVVRVFDEPGHHDIIGVDIDEFDIGQRDQVLGAVTTTAPDIIVHGAAFTAVDRCESEPDLAYRINTLAVRHFAEAARLVDAHLLYVSTDYVFDGTKPTPYNEWDRPSPASVYGATKLGGEMELGPGATVMRTSWVCGEHGANMVKTILGLLESHPTLSFVDDQHGHPSFCADLATMIYRLAVEKRPGTFHVTNQGAVSWYEFAQEVAKAAGQDPSRVEPCATSDLDPPRPAPRPANSVLDNAALRLCDIPLLRDFREPLAELVTKLTG